ncbi:MAG: DMT family transporter [Bacteriovoracia bacterium]
MLVAFLFMAFLVGCLLPWQPVVNARLGAELASPMFAGFVSFLGGSIVLGVIALLQGSLSDKLTRLSQAPNWTLTGGLLGAVIVVAAIFLVPKIGTTALGVSFIAGQLLMAVVMDHYGMAGLPVRSIDATRFVGLCIVVIGVIIVMRPAHAP